MLSNLVSRLCLQYTAPSKLTLRCQPSTRSRAITAGRTLPASSQSRTLMSLRLTPQSRTRLANASFLSAFLFSIFTVSYLSGQSPGRLPCPARPNGTGQRAEGEQVDGQEIVYIAPAASSSRPLVVKQAEKTEASSGKQETNQQQQFPEQEPRFGSISARLAYHVSKWRQNSG